MKAFLFLFIALPALAHDPVMHNSKGQVTASNLWVRNLAAGRFYGDGSGLTNLNLPKSDAPGVSPMVSAGALYLAPRQDGKAGTGAFNDPLNASTPDKLSDAWKIALAALWKTGGTLTLFPGTYYATNQLQLLWGSHDMVISGYGSRIIYTNAALPYNQCVICSFNACDRCSWRGLTVEVGPVTFTKPGKVDGIIVRGRDIALRDCTVRNVASREQEAFGVIFGGTNGTCTGNAVYGTSGDPVRGVTGLLVGGEYNTGSCNVVDLGDLNGADTITTFGFTIYGNFNTISGCTARGVDAALSMDGGGGVPAGTVWRGNVINACTLDANSLCLRIENNSQGFADWTINSCVFTTTNRWLSMWTGSPWISNKITGFKFTGNRFAGSPGMEWNMVLQNFESHTLEGNDFSEAPTILLGTTPDNIYKTGNTILGKPEQAISKQ